MGTVWEAYHKGVPLLGVPGITLDIHMSAEGHWMIWEDLVIVTVS